MASISGQNTSNIDQVDGFFTTQGGGATAAPVVTNGTQLGQVSEAWFNTAITPDFFRSPTTTHKFVKLASIHDYGQYIGIKANGELWYYANVSTYAQGMFTTLNAWTQYGTDTDWTDVTGGQICWGFIKGGNFHFMGYGGWRMRGDGGTDSPIYPELISSAETWEEVSMSNQTTCIRNTSGEMFFAGYNYDYGTGQGTTAGQTATFTQEQNSLTGVTYHTAGYRRCIMVKGGSIYTTGNNQNLMAGPLVSTNADINGPIITYSGTDITKVSSFGDDATLAITTGGQIRFAGSGGQSPRPDNSTANQQGTTGQSNEAFSILTGAGSGWTYIGGGKTSSGTNYGFGIQNGQAKIGGTYSSGIGAVMGGVATNQWKQIGSTSNFVALNLSGATTDEIHCAFSTS